MKFTLVLFGVFFWSLQASGQKLVQPIEETGIPISINWVDSLAGDYSFINNWNYPLGVEMEKDGKAGCADGGFCPQRCYTMLDSNGIVIKDSEAVFYQLLDTSHLYHTILCDAWCYEWAGTDFIDMFHKGEDSVEGYTATGIATHCSLHLRIIKDLCYSEIELNGIILGEVIFCCTNGFIKIDKKLWEQGIMKAEFSFDFDNKVDPKWPMFWKGKIYAKISKT